jgi:hypothetical protein
MKSDRSVGLTPASRLRREEAQNPTTPEGRIAFFVGLAQIPDQLREGDRLNVQADVQTVLGWSDAEAKKISIEEIASTKQRVLEELGKVAAANALNIKIGRHEDLPFASILLDPELVRSVALQVVPGHGIRAGGPLRPALLFTLFEALGRIRNPDYIRRCLAHDCARIFFAEHGNQFFCTPRCANREASWRFREAKKKPKKTANPTAGRGSRRARVVQGSKG